MATLISTQVTDRLAAMLAGLIIIVKIHTIGLIVGLAVVVVNLFWTTIEHSLRS